MPLGRFLSEEVVVVIFFFLACAFCWPWADAPSLWLAPVGTGVVLDELVVVLDDEPEPDGLCEGEVEVEVVPGCDVVEELVEVEELVLVVAGVVVVVVLVVTDTAGVVAVDGVHCSLSEATGPGMGRPIAEMGVPGGTLTWKVSTWPVTRVTVTVQSSAEAVGIDPMARAMKIDPAMASTASSLRRPITATPLRPSRWCAPQ